MKVGVVLTSIHGRTAAIKDLENGCAQSVNHTLYIAGDTVSSEATYHAQTKFLSISDQLHSEFELAKKLPVRNYGRKNIAYLTAFRDGSDYVIETDDDNHPEPDFFLSRTKEQSVRELQGDKFVNIYKYYKSDIHTGIEIWPRGFPLEYVRKDISVSDEIIKESFPVQSYLVDNDPDVDALYRLFGQMPVKFARDRGNIKLGAGSWSSFNTQNTIFFRSHAILMYQTVTPQFREADMIRSYIVQRLLWENNESMMFGSPTMYQHRNEHDLMDDLRQETQLYAYTSQLCSALDKVKLGGGISNVPDDFQRCLDITERFGFTKPEERALHKAWVRDVEKLGLL